MSTITDEQMMQLLQTVKDYTFVVLHEGPEMKREDARQYIWEHGRKNFQLRAEGKISVVGPITEEHEIKGIYIFNTGKEEATAIMNEDPAVKAGVFTFEAMGCKSFPGDSLA